MRELVQHYSTSQHRARQKPVPAPHPEVSLFGAAAAVSFSPTLIHSLPEKHFNDVILRLQASFPRGSVGEDSWSKKCSQLD